MGLRRHWALLHMITRRCTQRKLLLWPSKKTDEAFVFCFAVAAKRYDVGSGFGLGAGVM